MLLGLVFMSLAASIFYDIPQLNLGLVLHQHKDIHMPGEETETSSLKSSIRRILPKKLSRRRQDENESLGNDEEEEEEGDSRY